MTLYRIAVNVVAYMNSDSPEKAEERVRDAIVDSLDTDDCDFCCISSGGDPVEVKKTEDGGSDNE